MLCGCFLGFQVRFGPKLPYLNSLGSAARLDALFWMRLLIVFFHLTVKDQQEEAHERGSGEQQHGHDKT